MGKTQKNTLRDLVVSKLMSSNVYILNILADVKQGHKYKEEENDIEENDEEAIYDENTIKG